MLLLDVPRTAWSSLTLQPNLLSSPGSTHAKKPGAVAVEGPGLDSAPGPAPPHMLLSLHLLQAAEPMSVQGALCAASSHDQWDWACKSDASLFLR